MRLRWVDRGIGGRMVNDGSEVGAAQRAGYGVGFGWLEEGAADCDVLSCSVFEK